MYKSLGTQSAFNEFILPFGSQSVPSRNPKETFNIFTIDSDDASYVRQYLRRSTHQHFTLDGTYFAPPVQMFSKPVALANGNIVEADVEKLQTLYVDNPNNRFTAGTPITIFGRTKLRGQYGEVVSGGPLQQWRWEFARSQRGEKNEFPWNITYFPTVFKYNTYDPSGKKGGIGGAFMVSYACVYSAFPPDVSKDGNRGLLPFPSVWKRMELQPDEHTGKSIAVNVDATLIGDINSYMSIKAALENSFVANESYISFFPVVPDEQFKAGQPFDIPEKCKIHGASLGMAVFAAVSGFSSFHYTGYLKALYPNEMIQPRANLYDNIAAYTREQNIANPYPKYPTNPLTVAGYPPVTSAPTVQGTGLVKMVKQMNFVEQVGDIMFKLFYCTNVGSPLFMPAVTHANESMASYINTYKDNMRAMTWLNVLPTVYTTAMAEDGIPVAKSINDRQALMHTNFMGVTLDDISSLVSQCLFSFSTFDNGTKWQSFQFKRNQGAVEGFAAAYAQRSALTAEKAKERAAHIRQMKSTSGNEEQFQQRYEEYKQAAQNKRAEESAKKKAKSSAKKGIVKSVSTAVKNQIRDLLSEINNFKKTNNWLGKSKAEKKELFPALKTIYAKIKKIRTPQWIAFMQNIWRNFKVSAQHSGDRFRLLRARYAKSRQRVAEAAAGMEIPLSEDQVDEFTKAGLGFGKDHRAFTAAVNKDDAAQRAGAQPAPDLAKQAQPTKSSVNDIDEDVVPSTESKKQNQESKSRYMPSNLKESIDVDEDENEPIATQQQYTAAPTRATSMAPNQGLQSAPAQSSNFGPNANDDDEDDQNLNIGTQFTYQDILAAKAKKAAAERKSAKKETQRSAQSGKTVEKTSGAKGAGLFQGIGNVLGGAIDDIL